MTALLSPHDLPARFARDLAALTGAPVPRLGLAVSGGPDSLALLLLAAAAHPGRVEAATVDHGLRPGSRADADHVARRCADLGVRHETLSVRVVPSGEGLQSAARAARYAALEEWAFRRDIPVLLTGHHADDQAETLLMRLGRGSGVAGLAGIRSARALGRVRLYRPLLGWRRAELAEIAAPLDPVDDPANADPRHDRTLIRRRLADAAWLDPVALARSAAALSQAEDALAAAAETLCAARVATDGDMLTLNPADLPPELLRRVVLLCLRRVAPSASPRGERLAALLRVLARGGVATLAGVLCRGGVRYHFRPAPPRRGAAHGSFGGAGR